MRRSLLPAIALAAAAVMSVAAAPSLDSVPFMQTDNAGDANGLNGQGLDETVGSNPTGPASYAEGDILGARITSQYETVTDADGVDTNVLTGLEFRTALGAEPTAAGLPLIHRFMGSTGGCTFWVQAYTGSNGQTAHGDVSVRLFDGSCGLVEDPDATLGINETVRGDWLTFAWDADTSEMVVSLDLVTGDERLTSRINEGEYYMLDQIANRGNTGAATVPVVDEMLGGGYAVIGSDVPTA